MDFYKKRIEIVKSLKRNYQKILLTSAISLRLFDKTYDATIFRQNTMLASNIGINVYTKVPITSKKYIQPTFFFWRKLKKWCHELTITKKGAWITEAQAEPWEFENVVHTNKHTYPSTSPKRAKNLVCKLSTIGFTPILVWGCEYWYWHKETRIDGVVGNGKRISIKKERIKLPLNQTRTMYQESY